jgi:hypothetical protein
MHKRFAEEQLAIACDNDNQYVCGSQLFPAGHKLEEAVYCNHSLTCSSLVEANLYNANASTLSKLADSFAVSLCSSCGIEHLAPDRSEQLGCNQTVQLSAWQCWPLCSICSGHGVVPPQRKCGGTPAAAKRRVVGMKRKHKASSARGDAWGRGASRGGRGRSLGRGVCLSSDDGGDSSDGEGEQSADSEAEVEQSADSEDEVVLGNNRRPVGPGGSHAYGDHVHNMPSGL